MKKNITLFIVVLPYFAFAQFSKGQVYLGGSLGVSLYNYDVPAVSPTSPGSNNKINSFSLLPVVGIFLNEKVAVGGGVGYTSSKYEYDVTNFSSISSSKGITVSSFTRYYIPISSSVYFTGHGEVSFTRANQKDIQNSGTQGTTTQEHPSYTIGVALKPVFIFFPTNKWSIEASVGSLGYSYQRNLPNVSSTSSAYLNFGSFSFGLAYYFSKK